MSLIISPSGGNDTLETVTARGASTSTQLQLTGGLKSVTTTGAGGSGLIIQGSAGVDGTYGSIQFLDTTGTSVWANLYATASGLSTNTPVTVTNSNLYLTNGNLGINTTSPLATLQVGVSDALTNYQSGLVGFMLPTGSGTWLELAENTVNGTSFRISKDASSGIAINTNGKDISFKADAYDTTVAAAQMVLKTSGNVGIGTTSPGAKLDVRTSSSGATPVVLRLGNTAARAANQGATIGFWPNSDFTGATEGAYISGVETTGTVTNSVSLTFGTGSGGTATEKMRLDSSGNLGIGTTSPGAKLDVVGTAKISGTVTLSTIVAPSATVLAISGATSSTTAGTAYAVTITGGQGGDGTAAGKGGAVNIIGGRSGNNANSGAAVYGGAVNITGGAGNTLFASSAPGGVVIAGGAAQIAGQSGADVSISASSGYGSATTANGGNLTLSSGAGGGVGNNGYVSISALGQAGGTLPYIVLTTGVTERLRITGTGAWALAGAANYGTTGQVLTSQGNAAPVWSTVSGGGGITTGKAIAMAMIFGG